MLYLIHFDEPLIRKNGKVQHYLGFINKKGQLQDRFERHKSGDGAKILRRLNELGITYRVSQTFPGSRNDERAIKNKKKNFKHICPLCKNLNNNGNSSK